MFLDTSLEDMGIEKVQQLRDRYRENTVSSPLRLHPRHSLPAGPLGQGRNGSSPTHPDKFFPFTVGDGGLGEPYVMSSMAHFHTAYLA